MSSLLPAAAPALSARSWPPLTRKRSGGGMGVAGACCSMSEMASMRRTALSRGSESRDSFPQQLQILSVKALHLCPETTAGLLCDLSHPAQGLAQISEPQSSEIGKCARPKASLQSRTPKLSFTLDHRTGIFSLHSGGACHDLRQQAPATNRLPLKPPTLTK